METQAVQFSENELKRVVFSATLMSAIDKEIQEREWKIIHSFAGEHWKADYEDFIEFQKRIFLEVKDLLEDEVVLYETIDGMITEFGESFSQDQKTIVLSFIGYLFSGNGIAALDQSKVFKAFVERMRIEH